VERLLPIFIESSTVRDLPNLLSKSVLTLEPILNVDLTDRELPQ